METRTEQSLKAVKIGIYGNVALALFKMTVGVFALSVALIADGVDTISDVVKSVFVYRAIKMASLPPSPEYPYGYGRAETVVTNMVGMSVVFAAILIFMESIKDFGRSDAIGYLMMIGAAVSIVGKVGLSLYMFQVGKNYSNQAVLANAKDYLSDVFSSAAVLTGGVLIRFTNNTNFDPVASVFVSVLIGYMGVEIVKSSVPEIMEKKEAPEIIEGIDDIVKETPYAFHPHLVRIRKLGPYYLVDMHVELPGKMSLKKSHEVVTHIEKQIKVRFPQVKDVIIHSEPIGEGKDNWGKG